MAALYEVVGEGRDGSVSARITEIKGGAEALLLEISYGDHAYKVALESLEELERLIKAGVTEQTRWLIGKGIIQRPSKQEDVLSWLLEVQAKLVPSIMTAVRRALQDFYRNKYHTGMVKGLPAPEKTEVFLRKRVFEAYILVPQVVQDGKTRLLCVDCTPKQAEYLLRALRDRAEYVDEKGDYISIESILKAAGLDPSKPMDQLTVVRKPYLFVYTTSDNYILIARRPLTEGLNELYLEPMTPDSLRALLDELPQHMREQLKEVLMKVMKVPRTIQDNSDLLPTIAERCLLGDTGLPEGAIKPFIARWSELKAQAWSFDQIDPFMALIYKGYALPFPSDFMDYVPHAIIFTETSVGKTMLYRLITGEDPLTDVTPISLVGGISTDSRREFKGIVHGRYKILQIEGMESGSEREVLKLLIDYMKSGRACRMAGGKKICSEGSAPIVLTGNVRYGYERRGLTFQALVNMGALRNPQALGSRTLPFYLVDLKELRATKSKWRDIEEAWSRIRAVVDSTATYNLVTKAWRDGRVLEWLEEPVEPLDVNISDIEGAEDLVEYLRIVREYYAPRLKGLSLNAALFDYLDEVYKAQRTEWDAAVSRVLEKAQEYFEVLKRYLEESVALLAEDYRRFTQIHWERLPDYVKILAEGVHLYITRKALGERESNIIRDYDELREFVEEAAYGKLKRPRSIHDIVRKRLRDLLTGAYARALHNMGIIVTVDSEGKIRLEINIAVLNKFMSFLNH